MSLVTIDYFLSHGYSKFNVVNPADIQNWLDQAALFVPASLWGTHRINGIMLCAAHFLEMEWADSAQISGMTTAIAAGNSTTPPAAQQDDFQLTTWGRRFSFLRNGLLNGTISPLLDETFTGVPKFGTGFPL